MVSRREFLGALSVPAASLAIGGSFALRPLETAEAGDLPVLFPKRDRSFEPDACGEDFWFECARAFTVDRSLVNLNNGGVSPSPQFVQAAMKRHLDFSNTAPPYTMWKVLEPQREAVRQRFARLFGCDTEEVAFTRNASEGLQICQFGFDLRRGDEVLTTNQDYPRMLTTFKQRERREGIVLKQFSIPIPAEYDDEIVSLFRRHITPKTKLILMCHVINITGQLLPVRKVVAMARAKGIPVIVDGAHALAHFDFKISDLDCDYYATSLHKWLFAPHGTGMLYVRRDKIRDLWPLMAATEEQVDDIRKFEEIGTHPAANYLAIGEALTFHQGIGGQRKEERLRFLRDYWARRLLTHDRVRLHTSLKPEFSCGIATVQIDGVDSSELNDWLWKEHRILTTAINHDEFQGVRISPSVYTMLPELDRFCDAMEHVIRHGLPTA
ncbi:MAG: aminotransferase class V-fold PLP-dependent enzyme [Planctomycetes bacterium]|nr:aminotransferase class V-fold PLP-dependent enzyme [Planctomycetota bacterium]